MSKDIGIYIHIPFCISKCHYCDFVSYSNKENLIDEYIECVCSEILKNSEILSSYNISTIYIGGGTPSHINAKHIEKILSTLNLFMCKDSTDYVETTIEINPGCITQEAIFAYKVAGINRISIGVQSTHNDILKKIGRIHTYEDSVNAVKLCKICGINNISIDLMYPLPGLDYKGFSDSLNSIMNLSKEYDISHISIYNLEVHENTKLDFLLKEGYLALVDEDEEMKMKELLKSTLVQNDFLQYEISNFAKEGFESKHNLNYWNQGMYLGFGVNASSFLNGVRYSNVKEIEKYIDLITTNQSVLEEKIELDKLDLMKEFVILKLRLICGININEFKSRFKIDIYNIFKKEIDKLVNLELLIRQNDNIFLTEKGQNLANIVWREFV